MLFSSHSYILFVILFIVSTYWYQMLSVRTLYYYQCENLAPPLQKFWKGQDLDNHCLTIVLQPS